MQLYNAKQTLRFWFSTILDTVLRFLAHFIAVLRFFADPQLPPSENKTFLDHQLFQTITDTF